MVVPVVFAAVRFPYFQGRYMLPVWIALAMLAGMGIQRSTNHQLSPVILGSLWGVVHTWALITNLKRYAVGSNGEWARVFDSESWHPPMMSNHVALAVIVAIGGGVTAAVVGVLHRGATEN